MGRASGLEVDGTLENADPREMEGSSKDDGERCRRRLPRPGMRFRELEAWFWHFSSGGRGVGLPWMGKERGRGFPTGTHRWKEIMMRVLGWLLILIASRRPASGHWAGGGA